MHNTRNSFDITIENNEISLQENNIVTSTPLYAIPGCSNSEISQNITYSISLETSNSLEEGALNEPSNPCNEFTENIFDAIDNQQSNENNNSVETEIDTFSTDDPSYNPTVDNETGASEITSVVEESPTEKSSFDHGSPLDVRNLEVPFSMT